MHTSFLGSYVRVAVETEAAEAPVMLALEDTADVPAIGDRIGLSWTAENAIALEPDE
jgi:hypothetical protein